MLQVITSTSSDANETDLFVILCCILNVFPHRSNSFKGREAGCQGNAGGDLRSSIAHRNS